MIKIKNLYGTPWCSDCKRTKKFLGEQRISYNWVDIDADEEAAKFVESVNDGKRKVPTIVFEDGSIMVEPSNAELAEKFKLKADLGHEFHDLLIVGGGPAGLTAALYAARDGLDVVVVERASLGGQASYTERLDNYPGFPDGIAGGELAERIVKQCQRFGVEFLKATDVKSVLQDNNTLTVRTTVDDEIGARAIIIATGSKYRKLGVPGEDDLIGYKIHFCSTCDGPFYKGKKLAVIGGGNSAFEEAIFLARFASQVEIYGRSEWKASQVLLDKVDETENISLHSNAKVLSVDVGEKKSLRGVIMENTENKEQFTITPDGMFLFIGLSPNTSIVKGVVDTDEIGFIETKGNLMSSVDGIFAAGDCRAQSIKQAVAAMGEGAAAALHVREYLRTI